MHYSEAGPKKKKDIFEGFTFTNEPFDITKDHMVFYPDDDSKEDEIKRITTFLQKKKQFEMTESQSKIPMKSIRVNQIPQPPPQPVFSKTENIPSKISPSSIFFL